MYCSSFDCIQNREMDYVFCVLAFILMLTGIIGTLIPVLPGTLLSLAGVVVLKLSSFGDFKWSIVAIVASIVGFTILCDYLVPLYGVKKMGGSKYGIYGSILGLIFSFFIPIFGFLSFIIMPFVGALLGEWLKQGTSPKALRAALGSFLGFLVSTGISFIASLLIFFFSLSRIIHWPDFGF